MYTVLKTFWVTNGYIQKPFLLTGIRMCNIIIITNQCFRYTLFKEEPRQRTGTLSILSTKYAHFVQKLVILLLLYFKVYRSTVHTVCTQFISYFLIQFLYHFMHRVIFYCPFVLLSWALDTRIRAIIYLTSVYIDTQVEYRMKYWERDHSFTQRLGSSHSE